MAFRLVPIVEGHGEVMALPILLRRFVAILDLGVPIEISRPILQQRGALLKEGGIESAVRLAAIEIDGSGAILILIDSEGTCPAELAPALLARAKTARSDKSISLVLAHHEYEAWFLASVSSLQGRCRLAADIQDHPNPGNVHGCKEWLENRMPPTSKYSETADQPALTAAFDIQLARRAPSFDKLYRDFESICREASTELDLEER